MKEGPETQGKAHLKKNRAASPDINLAVAHARLIKKRMPETGEG